MVGEIGLHLSQFIMQQFAAYTGNDTTYSFTCMMLHRSYKCCINWTDQCISEPVVQGVVVICSISDKACFLNIVAISGSKTCINHVAFFDRVTTVSASIGFDHTLLSGIFGSQKST